MRWAETWLVASEEGKLRPPRDVHDAAGWNDYWKNHLVVGTIEQSFSDRMSSDTMLPIRLAARGVRSILCAGNGLSTEAVSLALLGFHVTALDISDVPARAFGATVEDVNEHPLKRIPGFALRDGIVTFRGTRPIDPELCPEIHRSPDYPPRSGGSLRFVTGDLVDPTVCPGPFDAVIERRTLQLFPEPERLVALERLVARLATRGVLVSHRHGAPSQTPAIREWLTSRGFVLHTHVTVEESSTVPRLARLVFTSG